MSSRKGMLLLATRILILKDVTQIRCHHIFCIDSDCSSCDYSHFLLLFSPYIIDRIGGKHGLFRTFSSAFLKEEVANLTGNDLIGEFMHVPLVTIMTSYCCHVVLIGIQDSVTDIKLLPSHAET